VVVTAPPKVVVPLTWKIVDGVCVPTPILPLVSRVSGLVEMLSFKRN
jgi:hypothetical protein